MKIGIVLDVDSNIVQTLALIPLYAKIQPEDPANSFVLPSDDEVVEGEEGEFDFESSQVVLSETKREELASRFRREADAYFVEAKRSLVSSIAQIPYWMYGVLAVLGWNEFVAVLRSPVYFTFCLILLAAAYVVYQLNMVSLFPKTGSILLMWADGRVTTGRPYPVGRPRCVERGDSCREGESGECARFGAIKDGVSF
jgi:hypothetical protein